MVKPTRVAVLMPIMILIERFLLWTVMNMRWVWEKLSPTYMD